MRVRKGRLHWLGRALLVSACAGNFATSAVNPGQPEAWRVFCCVLTVGAAVLVAVIVWRGLMSGEDATRNRT